RPGCGAAGDSGHLQRDCIYGGAALAGDGDSHGAGITTVGDYWAGSVVGCEAGGDWVRAGRDGGSAFDAADAIASVWGESIRSGDADAGSAGDFCAGAWRVLRSGATGGVDRSDAGAPGGLAPSTS